MNLWFSHLLVAGLVLTTSALTPEECQPLLKPLSLADSSMLHGRLNLIMGYSDTEAVDTILKSTESYWIKMTPSPSDKNELTVHEENKINGTCIILSFNMTIDGDAATMSVGNISKTLNVLPSCDGCVVFKSNITGRNTGKLFRHSNININITDEEVTSHATFLLARETTVKDSDLEQFKQQASCLGFTGEPDFKYDPKNGAHGDYVQVLDSLRGRHRDYVQVLDSLRGRHRDYVQVLDSLRGRLRDYVQVLDSLRGRHRDYVQVLDSLRGRHRDYVQVLDSLRGRHRDYVQVLDSLQGRHRDYVQVLDGLRGHHRDYVQVLDSLQGRHRDYVQVLDGLRGHHRDYVQVLDSLQGRLRDYVQILDSLQGRLRDYVQVLDSLQGRLRDYVQVLDSLQGLMMD
ncbi:hypothetical protein GBF38_010601 [Nibea albiflora]|uniref:Uncharacterized protein n=1 Tax=Nibea albiflora TaxID=240163 RepID=A0ACB7ES86_NIBAL|nr:hypothetical protein GBF38_010601 [Nibea albiflora]